LCKRKAEAAIPFPAPLQAVSKEFRKNEEKCSELFHKNGQECAMIKLIPKGKEGCRMRLQYVLLAAVLAVSGLSFSSQAAASPLKNYSAGRIAVSGGGTFPTSIEFDDFDTEGKKASVYGGVTAGLGGKTALNYRYDQYQTDHDDIQTNQLNLM
jgi:hypothetical protein